MAGKTYSDLAKLYHDRGYFPLPLNGKDLRATGITGRAKPLVGTDARDRVKQLVRQYPDSNTGIRIPQGALGWDIDQYVKAGVQKEGAAHHAQFVQELGNVPSTWTITSRGQGQPSRISLFRVPEGLDFDPKPSDSIEVLQWWHRYAVAPGSIHPDTGQLYRLYHPNGERLRIKDMPEPDMLPDWPDAWIEKWSRGPSRDREALEITDGEVQTLIESAEPGPPCWYVQRGLNRIMSYGHIGHDEALKELLWIFMAIREGHHGLNEPYDILLARFIEYQTQARPHDRREVSAVVQSRAALALSLPVEARCHCLDNAGLLLDYEPAKVVAEQEAEAEQPIDPWKAEETIPLLRASELMLRKPPGFLIENLLQEQAVAILGGPGGVGKSFMALDWACRLGLGMEFYGLKVRRAKTIYVAAEGVSNFGKRIAAWQEAHNVRVPDEAIAFVEEGVRLSDEESMKALGRVMVRFKPDLVILDTLSQLADIDNENDAAQIARVMKTAKWLRDQHAGSTVMIVHHANRSEKQGLRGSSALRNNVDTVVMMRDTGEMSFAVTTEMKHDGKQKDAEPVYMPRFTLAPILASAVVMRAETGPPDALAIVNQVLGDLQKHSMSELLVAWGKLSDDTAARKQLQRAIESDQSIMSEGNTRGKLYWRAGPAMI